LSQVNLGYNFGRQTPRRARSTRNRFSVDFGPDRQASMRAALPGAGADHT
jgi:hypothetical protein